MDSCLSADKFFQESELVLTYLLISEESTEILTNLLNCFFKISLNSPHLFFERKKDDSF